MSFIPSPLALMRTGIIRDESCEIATANGLHPLPLLNYPCSCFIKNAPRFARRSSLDFQSRKNLLLVAHDARVRHWLRHERVPPHSSNYYFFYHNTKLRQDRDLHPNSPADRNIAFDRMYVNYTDNMVASCDVHTAMGPPPLKYLNPFTQTPSFLLSSCTEGVNTSPSTSAPRTLEAQPLTLVNVTDGSETRLRFVDFGNTGAKR